MSQRWRFQFRSGLIFGLVYTIMMCLMNENSLEDQFSSTKFYIRILANILVGVFVIGYFMWKGQFKNHHNWLNSSRTKPKK